MNEMGLPKKPLPRNAEICAKDGDAGVRIAFHNGDVHAFEQLCTPHLDLVYTLALRIVGNHVGAEEVAQDAMVRALSRCHQYDPKRAFRPWLLSIATNLARDRTRTVWYRRIIGISTEFASAARAPDAKLDAAERDQLVRDALMGLPIKYREALTLYHLRDISYAEMAEITGASVSALKQRVRRGQVMLRTKLQKLYPTIFPPRSDGRGDQ